MKALDARPAVVPPGHYLVPVRLHVPAECLTRSSPINNLVVPEQPTGLAEVCEVKA